MVLSQELQILQNGLLEASETKYSIQVEKYLRRNENEPFWQWFGKPIQFQVWWILMAAKRPEDPKLIQTCFKNVNPDPTMIQKRKP